MKYSDLTATQKKAVCKELDIDKDDLENVMDKEDYLILTDEEADEKAAECVKESIWAFNASFLSGETGIDEEVFTAIQKNDRCESNNPAILSLVEANGGLDSFIENAISADGRGSFLTTYDGNEIEINCGKQTIYAYRMN